MCGNAADDPSMHDADLTEVGPAIVHWPEGIWNGPVFETVPLTPEEKADEVSALKEYFE